jgi:hypothetical protein
MEKTVKWRDNLLEKPPLNIHRVSERVQVLTSYGRIVIGYWDASRGMWFLDGTLTNEHAVQWTNLLETLE